MEPLMPHMHMPSMMKRIHSLGDFLRSIHKPGPAAEHQMGPILPKSIFSPGAHPKHLQKEDKDEAKQEDKKEDKKEDSKMENKDKKSDKKEDSKPKSESE